MLVNTHLLGSTLCKQRVGSSWDVFVRLLKWHVLGESHQVSRKDLDICDREKLLFFITRHRLDLALFPKISGIFSSQKKLACTFLKFQKTLVEIVKSFQNEDIFVVVLKGVPLNQLLYGQQCIRRSKDIDLWISPKDLLYAHRCLERLGFSLVYPLTPEVLLSSNTSFLKDVTVDFSYKHSSNKVFVELHQHAMILPCISFPSPKKCQLITVLETPISILNNESYFIYLCVHASLHHWRRLQWLADLGVFYQKYSLDWPTVMNIVQEKGCTRSVYEALFLLHSVFGFSTPSSPLSAWDRLCIGYRCRSLKKCWQQEIQNRPHWDYFLASLLYTRLHHKWKLVIGSILRVNRSMIQIMKYPSRPLWCVVLVTVFSHYTKKDFKHV